MNEEITATYHGGRLLVYHLLQTKIGQVTEREDWTTRCKELTKIIGALPEREADIARTLITELLDMVAKNICQETFMAIDTFYHIPLPDEMADALTALDWETALLNFNIKPLRQKTTEY